jgi:hypothetical protein
MAQLAALFAERDGRDEDVNVRMMQHPPGHEEVGSYMPPSQSGGSWNLIFEQDLSRCGCLSPDKINMNESVPLTCYVFDPLARPLSD